MSEKFRLKAATIALFPEDDRHVARVVPQGAVIDVQSLSDNKFIEVIWQGQSILMFAQDVRVRGEKLDRIAPA
jgi:hypothetical protein